MTIPFEQWLTEHEFEPGSLTAIQRETLQAAYQLSIEATDRETMRFTDPQSNVKITRDQSSLKAVD